MKLVSGVALAFFFALPTLASAEGAGPPAPPLAPLAGCQAKFIEAVYGPDVIEPTGFAFATGGGSAAGSWTFHLFYARQNQISRQLFGEDSTEKNLGHAVSSDLMDWTVLDTAVIEVRPGRWDSRHVRAPSIVRRGSTYFMFYTGVDATGRQRIGIATSLDLMSWVQGDSLVSGHAGGNAGDWVDPAANDLRDPFVMEDPDDPERWLVYFTARATEYPGMAAGFVRVPGANPSYDSVLPGGALWATQQDRQSGLESPHVFHRAGRWWLFFTKPVVARDTVYALSTASGPSDTATANWSPIQSIRDLVPLNEASAYNRWHATEYLKVAGSGAGKEYFAGLYDGEQAISYTQMIEVAPPFLFGGDCPNALDVPDDSPRPGEPALRLLSASPGELIELEVSLPVGSRASVTLMDALGRNVRTLADDYFPAGRTTLRWDGLGPSGAQLASGIYLATLVLDAHRRTVRVPWIR